MNENKIIIKDKYHNYEDFPQYLCNGCGGCCTVVTTMYSLDELKEMAEQGEEEAKAFTEIFQPYPSIEDARKVMPEHVNNIIETLKQKNYDLSKLTFYYCRHKLENNMCAIYENRPECCRRAPSSGWSIMPPGCGFEGWQFEQREAKKKQIRKLKEYLYYLDNLSENDKISNKDIDIKEQKKNIEEQIKLLENYGARYC